MISCIKRTKDEKNCGGGSDVDCDELITIQFQFIFHFSFHDLPQKEELMQVLNEASALSNLLLLSVSDQFELCLAKCRTSSR
jgi:hypothetical protein